MANSKLSVWGQAALAFKPGNRSAGWLSVPWGASIPLATHAHALAVDAARPLSEQPYAYLAAGGLVYSGLTVYGWMRETLIVECETDGERWGATFKALGFVVLSEGTLVYAPRPWLSIVMLVLLMAANAIAMHAKMVLHRERERGHRQAELDAAVADERARWEAQLEAEKEARRQKRRKNKTTEKSGVRRKAA